jgi:hypothetical protein
MERHHRVLVADPQAVSRGKEAEEAFNRGALVVEANDGVKSLDMVGRRAEQQPGALRVGPCDGEL